MTSAKYDRIIVQQLDPDAPAAGGVDSCLRDLLAHAPQDMRILLVGVSLTEPLRRLRTKKFGTREVDFIAVARLDPMARRRVVPHSFRIVLGAIAPLLRYSSKTTTIETHRFEAGFLASLVKRGKQVVYAHTDPIAVVGDTSDSFWRRLPRLYDLMESRVLKKASRTIVFSRRGAAHYTIRFQNITRASTWYNDEIFKLSSEPREARSLLWVGRFEAPKDPLLALDVLREINERDDQMWKMVMIGDGSQRHQLEAEVKKRSLGESVSMAGVKSREDVSRALSRSAALLMTSNFEGSPVVLYEAMAVGTPVIAPEAADPDHVILDGVNGMRATRSAKVLAQATLDLPVLDPQVVATTVADRAMAVAVQEVWALAR